MDGTQLFELASGFKLSRALQVAACRGLFRLLLEEPLALPELARRLDWSDGSLDGVLAVLVPAGLLRREEERFHVPSEVAPYVAEDGPESVVNTIRWMAYQYRQYDRLVPDSDLGDHMTDTWMSCLHELGRKEGYARLVAEALPLQGARTVLDLGGGSGVYSMAMCEIFPDLIALVFDRPHVAKLAERFISASGCSPRIRAVPGDFLTDDLPQGTDAVFVSNVFHGRDPATVERLCRKIMSSLSPGGWIIVHGQHVASDYRHSMDAGLLHLTMSLNGGGRCYSVEEIKTLLMRLGFENLQERQPRRHPTADLVMAAKPPHGA